MNLHGLDFPLKEFFIEIFQERVYLVGGVVRDFLLYGTLGSSADIDLMVVGYTYEEIEKLLKPHGKTNTVGKSFAVVKFTREGHTYDLAVPRRDTKKEAGQFGHRNFLIECGPHISLEEDLSRRDFTCNSIALRLLDHLLVDPFDGWGAIQKKRIVMTGPETFVDDPLRILRAARFASVHGFAVDEAIYACAKDVPLDELSKERVTEEWFRLLLESPRPSLGMMEYFKLSVLEKLFPPFYPLTLTIQDAIFHPEHDEYGHHTVWAHVMLALDIAQKNAFRFQLNEERRLALLVGVLFHDVGKAVTTRWEFKKGRMTITSMFHDSKGVDIAENFLSGLKIETRMNFPLKKTVLNLVQAHHRVYELYRNREEIGYKAFSRLVRDLADQDLLLVLLDFADRQSREPEPLNFSELDEISLWYFRRKEELKLSIMAVQPLVLGRDLLRLGIEPGIKMGAYLKQLYERQLDGEFSTKEQGLTIFQQIR